MGKYIRTKDGVYERMFPDTEHRISFDHKTIEPTYYTTKRDWVAKKDVIKQADTIEELIDEYVRVHKTMNNRSMICDKELAISSNKYPKHYDIYGSIWVDGELHKVAKMNEKGELELL